MERDWSAVVDRLVELLHRYYLDPAVAERVADVLEAQLASGTYAGCVDEKALAAAVTEDTVAAGGDLHLVLRHSVAALPERDDPVVPESGRHPDEARLSAHGFARVENLPGNVGHLDIRKFFPVSMSGDAAIGAMRLVADSDALLVDLRRCLGGEPDMVVLASSFLFDEPTHLFDLCFPGAESRMEYWTEWTPPGPAFGGTKPVWVLTSRGTISAAEGFSYDLQQLGRAVLVGETTAGAANFDYRYRVSDHLMFSVPSGYPVNAVSGEHWEGTGVRPDIAVAAEEAFTVGYRLALRHVVGLGAAGHRGPIHAAATQALAGLG